MLCKWCGETVTPADRQCRRCGRELPALSDCGGFYDLVNIGAPPVRTAVQPETKVDLSGVQGDIRRTSAMERKHMNRLLLLTLIGFALTLALLLVLLLQVGSLHTRIDELEQTIEALHIPEEEENTEPDSADSQPEDTQSLTETEGSTEATQDTASGDFWEDGAGDASEEHPTEAEDPAT